MSGIPQPYTVAEAAERLKISRALAYKLIAEGRFPVATLRIGNLIRIPRRPLDAFADGGER